MAMNMNTYIMIAIAVVVFCLIVYYMFFNK
ncbi:MAG: hypothetical protein UV38_C0002G0044 [candidate division TM6 bacterium GW2011_GWE2_42_60]|nr:MAG: hypothetical protein UV38_C0002G0044 [candidate division TM6 bacterium GW2011_GWE2_42_60]